MAHGPDRAGSPYVYHVYKGTMSELISYDGLYGQNLKISMHSLYLGVFPALWTMKMPAWFFMQTDSCVPSPAEVNVESHARSTAASQKVRWPLPHGLYWSVLHIK